eukprot:3556204-Rhodomonas_salina.2
MTQKKGPLSHEHLQPHTLCQHSTSYIARVLATRKAVAPYAKSAQDIACRECKWIAPHLACPVSLSLKRARYATSIPGTAYQKRRQIETQCQYHTSRMGGVGKKHHTLCQYRTSRIKTVGGCHHTLCQYRTSRTNTVGRQRTWWAQARPHVKEVERSIRNVSTGHRVANA